MKSSTIVVTLAIIATFAMGVYVTYASLFLIPAITPPFNFIEKSLLFAVFLVAYVSLFAEMYPVIIKWVRGEK